MDGALFIAMNGLQHRLGALASCAHNIANASTSGYKAEEFTIKPTVISGAVNSRTYGNASEISSHFKEGPMIATENTLDIAVDDSRSKNIGFIAVQTPDGQEGLTRSGSLSINKNGLLVTSQGDLVLQSKGGVITLTDATNVSIAKDGTINGQRAGDSQTTNFGQIKLVEIAKEDVTRRNDGLYGSKNNSTVPASANIRILDGFIEGSNVNPMTELAKLIDISRSYEMQTRVMKMIQEFSTDANKLLDTTN